MSQAPKLEANFEANTTEPANTAVEQSARDAYAPSTAKSVKPVEPVAHAQASLDLGMADNIYAASDVVKAVPSKGTTHVEHPAPKQAAKPAQAHEAKAAPKAQHVSAGYDFNDNQTSSGSDYDPSEQSNGNYGTDGSGFTTQSSVDTVWNSDTGSYENDLVITQTPDQ